MYKRAIIIGVLIFVFVFVGKQVERILIRQNTTPSAKINNPQSSKALKFSVLEMAKTSAEKEQGLMNRDSLCADCGMIFVFDKAELLSFWMKNTKIPLDIVFIDEGGKIVQIHQNTTPFQTSPTYGTTKPAKYVIETNAFYIEKNSLNIGDILNLNELLSSAVKFQSNKI